MTAPIRARLILLCFWIVCTAFLPLISLWQLVLIAFVPARSLKLARAIDIAGATALTGSANRTLSYKAARAAEAGNEWGELLCSGLNDIDPQHCQNALSNKDFTIKGI